MGKTLVLRENDVRLQIVTCYKQYLLAQRRKNQADINQTYGRLNVWRSLFDEMSGDTELLDAELEAIEAKVNK